MLHPLDHPKRSWTPNELQWFMVFCILDSNVVYKTVCKAIDALKNDWVTRSVFKMQGPPRYVDQYLIQRGHWAIRRILKEAGYPWYNQKTRYLLGWARSPYSDSRWLQVAERDEMVTHIKGISMKLASMYLRNTRGGNYAVLDRHILRAMGEKYPTTTRRYEEIEQKFLARAAEERKTPYQLDMEIWEKERRKVS